VCEDGTVIEIDLSKKGAKSAVLRELKRLGLCDSAEVFKLQVRQELITAKVHAAAANEQAWGEMVRMCLPREIGEKIGVIKLGEKKVVSLPPSPAEEKAEEVKEVEEGSEEEPEEPEESAADSDPKAMAALLKKLSPVDFFEDICWVYLNLAHKDVRPDQAPNAGAWGLLEHVRKYPKAFFDQLLPKALAKAPNEEDGIKREKRQIEEIEDMLFKLAEEG
jgi:hypothetical protein